MYKFPEYNLDYYFKSQGFCVIDIDHMVDIIKSSNSQLLIKYFSNVYIAINLSCIVLHLIDKFY